MLNVLSLGCFLLIILASVPLWRNAIRRTHSGDGLLPIRNPVPSPLGAVDVLGAYVFGFSTQIVCILLITAVQGIELDSLGTATANQKAWLGILVAGSQLVSTAIVLLYLYRRYQRTDVLGWQPSYLIGDIGLGFKAFAMVIPAILIVQWLLTFLTPYKHSTIEDLRSSGSILVIISAWFAAGLAAPICEEVLFRGLLQGWLQRLGSTDSASMEQKIMGGWGDGGRIDAGYDISISEQNPRNMDSNPYASPANQATRKSNLASAQNGECHQPLWPIFVSAAFFGLMHLGQGAAPIPLFLFGIALGYLYRRTGSLIPCIVLHILLNGFSLFWITVNVFFGEPETESLTGFADLFSRIFS